MRTFIRAAVLSVISIAFLANPTASGQLKVSDDWTDTTAKAEQSIFRVEGFEEGSERPWTCTAVLVQEKLVLTAAHCIPEYGGYNTVNNIRGKLVQIDRDLDLALLAVPFTKKSGKVIKLRTAPLQRGTEVAIVGYAFGAPAPKATYGWVSDPSGSIPIGGNYGDMTGCWFDMTVIGGHSGGPVVDKDGRLVSIAQASLNDRGSYLTFGPTPMAVRLFLLAYLQKAK